MRIDTSINNLKSLIEIAIELDNKLYKQAIEKRYQNLRERADIYFESISESRSNGNRLSNNKQDYASNY